MDQDFIIQSKSEHPKRSYSIGIDVGYPWTEWAYPKLVYVLKTSKQLLLYI